MKRSKEVVWSLSYNPIHDRSALHTFQRPDFLIPSYSGLGFQCMNFGGDTNLQIIALLSLAVVVVFVCLIFKFMNIVISSVQLSCSVMSNCLGPHGLQHARLACPSPTPGAYSNSCPLSQWCRPTTSSPVILFSSCLQSFPAPGSFQKSQFFSSGGQSITCQITHKCITIILIKTAINYVLIYIK